MQNRTPGAPGQTASQASPKGKGRPPRTPLDRVAIGRALSYLTHYRRQAAMPYVFLFIATVSMLIVPSLLRRMIDAVTQGVIADTLINALGKIPAAFMGQALPKILDYLKLPTTMSQADLTAKLAADRADAPNVLIISAIAIVAFAIFRGLFAFLQAYWAERNSQSIAYDMRNDLFAKIQRLSFSYHDRNQTGQLMVRATDDIEKVRIFIGQGLLQLAGAFVLIVGALIIIFTTNAQLALVVLPILPVAFVLFAIFGSISQPLFIKVQQRLSALNTLLQENLAGIKVVQAFVRERSEQDKFKTAADRVMQQQITVARLFTLLFPLTFLVANLGQAATLYFGGKQIIAGTLSIGEWQEFTLYLVYLFFPMAQFGFIITQLGQAAASATRVFEILDTKNDVTDKPGAAVLPSVRGKVTFDNVTFRYFHGGEPVLKNVSFEVEPDRTVALLGATGSGKTTIINLIPRFYDASEGAVRIDGVDVRDVTLNSLRSQIGIVLQETNLFSGTIRDNIAFGRSDASMDEVIAVAKAAAAHDFILSFPQGYDTPVGERGTTLSGGQKQRIAIARALLLNPHILILDDSTSSVDLNTEKQIQAALDTLMKGRTSFVIAQRISTVMKADLILVLDKGQIVASGTHRELMDDSAIYAEIYNSQLVGETHSETEIIPDVMPVVA
jgi:ATP-binding cassette subfamily B protein